MTFKAVVLSETKCTVFIASADNDNVAERFPYQGICRYCHGEQESNDPDVACLRCGEWVEYTRKPSVI